MNRALKIILISLIAVLGVGLLFIKPVQAVDTDFVVEFENKPLFNEANFIPGEDVSRFVKVTNNTGISQKVGTRVSDFQDIDKLGGALNLQIKDGGISLFSSTLSDFFKADVIYFSEIPAHSSIQYDFIITFIPESGDTYQGKTLIFDFIVGRDIPSTTTTTTTSASKGGDRGGGGIYSTTTTIITEPGQVKGITTESEPLEEVIGQKGEVPEGTQNTNNVTTATTTPGVVLGAATEAEPSSCKANLLSLGINPVSAYLLCLGQEACNTCSGFCWLIMLLGIAIVLIILFLAATKHLSMWIVFLAAIAVLAYLLLLVLGGCLNLWWIFIFSLALIIIAFLLSNLRLEKK